MTHFEIVANERVRLDCPSEIATMFTLSPYVWREADGYAIMMRVVPDCANPAEKIARIHLGRSHDGLAFTLGKHPVIAPGPSPDDIDGCEDPSVAVAGGKYYVYYTGWNEPTKTGKLLYAVGNSPERLRKCGVAIEPRKTEANIKEAMLVRTPAGGWRMFFEYAAEGASRIGMAAADAPDGPWAIGDQPFAARPGRWDSWHLSPGPIVQQDGRAIMFYNGANEQAAWRVGWIVLAPDCSRVLDRCEEPLIAPGERGEDWTDIAFVSSCLCEGDGIRLYYSVADRLNMRATIRPA